MVYRRKRKYRKFGRRRNYVRGRLRRFRRIFRKFKRTFRRNTRILKFGPKQLSPEFAFLKVQFSKDVNLSNASPSVLDTILLANSLNESNDFGSLNGVSYPVWQMAQWYSKYYIWKTKLEMWINPTNVALTPTDTCWENDLTKVNPKGKQFTAYITADSTGIPYNDVNWSYDGNSDNPMDHPHSSFKHFTSYGALYKPIYVKYTMRTKKLFGQKTATLLDYQGSITPTGTLAAPTFTADSPPSQYFFHYGILGEVLLNPTNQMKAKAILRVTKWVRFQTQRNKNLHVIENT